MERAAATTLTGPADALRDEEVERTRAFLRLGWLVAAGTVIAVIVVPGDRRIAAALLATLALAVLGSLGLARELRAPGKPHARGLDALAVVAIACGQLGILYVGCFSAAPLIVALGLVFFCRTEHRASAICERLIAARKRRVRAGFVTVA